MKGLINLMVSVGIDFASFDSSRKCLTLRLHQRGAKVGAGVGAVVSEGREEGRRKRRGGGGVTEAGREDDDKTVNIEGENVLGK